MSSREITLFALGAVLATAVSVGISSHPSTSDCIAELTVTHGATLDAAMEACER